MNAEQAGRCARKCCPNEFRKPVNRHSYAPAGEVPTLLAELLPAGFFAAEETGDPPGTVLYPAEREAVRAVTARGRREFTTVRGCARRALAECGLPPAPLVPGPGGAPGWPPGVVGSMTHCDGYRAAAVARASTAASVGIDAEPHRPLPPGLVRRIVSGAEEDERVRRLEAEEPSVCWDRLLFCVKEAVYKAWFPLTGRPLGFRRVSAQPDPATGEFTATLHPSPPAPGGLGTLTGRWSAREGLLVVAVTVPAPRPAGAAR